MNQKLTQSRSLLSLSGHALGLSALAVIIGYAAPAHADVACGDTTCPTGYECLSQEGACPAIAIDEGSGGAQDLPACTPTTQYYCSPLPCTTDADCASGMVCYTYATTNCATTAVDTAPCLDQTNCPEPESVVPANCEDTTTSQCVPQWTLPCTTAADCGDGFTCDEQERCACSGGSTGSASSGSSGEGAVVNSPDVANGGAASTETSTNADPIVEPTCSCEPTGTYSCNPVVTSCTSDADCLSGWTCEASSTSAGCAVSSDGQEVCPEPASEMTCMPPYAEEVRGSGAVDILLDGEASTPTANEADNAAADESTDNASGASGGGCALVDPGRTSGSGMLLLGLVMAAVLASRRRSS